MSGPLLARECRHASRLHPFSLHPRPRVSCQSQEVEGRGREEGVHVLVLEQALAAVAGPIKVCKAICWLFEDVFSSIVYVFLGSG